MSQIADPIVASVVTTLIGAIGAVLVFSLRGIWHTWPWSQIKVDRVEARYLAPGFRMRYVGEPGADPVVFDNIETDLAGAILLEVPVRLTALNRGPVAETITRIELLIGYDDGKPLVAEALQPNGDRFQGCEVPGNHGFREVAVVFRLGSDRFGDRAGWNYSRGSVWILSVLTSKGRRYRFDLSVNPGRPATVSIRRVHLWERPALANTGGKLDSENEAA